MNWNEYFMRHVYLAASKSKDARTKIGAVLVKDNIIISEGYNGFPRKVLDSKERYLDRFIKHKYVSHAESNSILNCARNGISTLNSVLYTQGIPCHECAKQIIQSGISKCIVHKQWPNLVYSKEWVESISLAKIIFEETGIIIELFDQQLKINGFLDGKIIGV